MGNIWAIHNEGCRVSSQHSGGKTVAKRATRQTTTAYTSSRGDAVKVKRKSQKPLETTCTNVFSNNPEKKTLNVLWAEVINHLEQTNFVPTLENPVNAAYNGQVQSRTHYSRGAMCGE